MENHEIKKVLTFIKATIKTHGSSGLDFAIKQSLGRSLPQDDFAQVVYYLRNQGKLIVDNFDGVGWVASPQGFLKRNPFLEKVLIAVISGGISLRGRPNNIQTIKTIADPNRQATRFTNTGCK